MVQIVSEPVNCDFIEAVESVVPVAVFYTSRSKLYGCFTSLNYYSW